MQTWVLLEILGFQVFGCILVLCINVVLSSCLKDLIQKHVLLAQPCSFCIGEHCSVVQPTDGQCFSNSHLKPHSRSVFLCVKCFPYSSPVTSAAQESEQKPTLFITGLQKICLTCIS